MAKRKKIAVGKPAVIVSAVVLLVLLAVGGTLAYLTAKTGTLKNVFNPSNIEIELKETFEEPKDSKTNVFVENTGSAAAYIRARVVVTWKKTDDSGNVYAKAPVKDEDYTMTMPESSDWTLGSDGFYYYKNPVDHNAETGILISECKLGENVTPPEGYNLSVEIIAQGIQAVPASAVNEAWTNHPPLNTPNP